MPAFGVREEDHLLEVWVSVDRLDHGHVTFQQFKDLLTTFRPTNDPPGPAEYDPRLQLTRPQPARQPFGRHAEPKDGGAEGGAREGNYKRTLCYDSIRPPPSTVQIGRLRSLHDGTRPHVAEFGFGSLSHRAPSSATPRLSGATFKTTQSKSVRGGTGRESGTRVHISIPQSAPGSSGSENESSADSAAGFKLAAKR
jgi:hypothetical protein